MGISGANFTNGLKLSHLSLFGRFKPQNRLKSVHETGPWCFTTQSSLETLHCKTLHNPTLVVSYFWIGWSYSTHYNSRYGMALYHLTSTMLICRDNQDAGGHTCPHYFRLQKSLLLESFTTNSTTVCRSLPSAIFNQGTYSLTFLFLELSYS